MPETSRLVQAAVLVDAAKPFEVNDVLPSPPAPGELLVFPFERMITQFDLSAINEAEAGWTSGAAIKQVHIRSIPESSGDR